MWELLTQLYGIILIITLISLLPAGIILLYISYRQQKYYESHPAEAEKRNKSLMLKRELREKKLRPIFNFISEFISGVIMFFLTLLTFAALIATLGRQIYSYLKTGLWKPLSCIDIMVWLNLEWASHPKNWHGVWKILNAINPAIPLFLFLFILIAVQIYFEYYAE